MDFLGVGLPELLLIMVVAFIVVGPHRLPQTAVQIARVVKSLRRYAAAVTADLRGELDELTKEYEEVKGEIKQLRASVSETTAAVTTEAERVISEGRQALPRQPIVETTSEPPPANTPPGDTAPAP